MKTVSVNVASLSVPCENRCRYCLLSWDGRCRGLSYEASRDYARGFHDWIQENRPDLSFQFYFGYSMEHPDLLNAVEDMAAHGYVQGEFLQFDGMKFRTPEESLRLLQNLKERGIRMLDFTFYGTRDYHDRFAARAGDYDYMMTLLSQAQEIGLDTEVGVPLTHENADQAEELIGQILLYNPKNLFCTVPHGEGRGLSLDRVRFSKSDYDALPELVRSYFNRSLYKTEGEWVSQGVGQMERRAVTVVPTPENISDYRAMGYEQTLAHLEQLDDDYHRAVPSDGDLMKLYGNPDGQQLYSRRDLIMHLQRRYIAEHGLALYDVYDERHSFIRRF